MSGAWGRLLERLRGGAETGSKLSIKERFASFQTVSSANDVFLKTLAELSEIADRRDAPAADLVREGCDSLCESAMVMVRALIAMSGNRYVRLAARCETLVQELSAALPRPNASEPGPLVIWPEDGAASRPEIVGGKAANLSRWAAAAGVQVPPYFVLTAAAYRDFIREAGLLDRTHEILRLAGRPNARALRAQCDLIGREILAASLPAALAASLEEAYAQLCARRTLAFGVAVRSSAVMENLESSFAGQFETVLGVRREELAAAYKRVVASRFSFPAMHYALLSGFGAEEVAMPVMVMVMVQPAVSGVAYSRSPDRPDGMLITAVAGLAQGLMDGRVLPERLLVARAAPHDIIERDGRATGPILRCSLGGGLVPGALPPVAGGADLVDAGLARAIAAAATRLEKQCGAPQDVEWAADEQGALFVVQRRPLRVPVRAPGSAPSSPPVDGYRLLLSGAVRACGGIACGTVAHLDDLDATDAVPDGAVLVTPTTSPKLSAVMGRIAAIVAEAGSPTGHMATVAREFGVPTLVGAAAAMTTLSDQTVVTVDAWSGNVYEGRVTALLASQAARGTPATTAGEPTNRLARLLDQVTSLSLQDPRAPGFTVENCRSLHDVARFVHQKAMTEIFHLEALSAGETSATQHLKWRVPMDVLILDLGGGLREHVGRVVEASDILSVPLRALIEGMTDPRLRWAGPVGFDLKGFVSVVVRSAADDQRYGEPGFALCSREYAQFSSRLAYHFAAVDAMCCPSVNQNYARLVFFGGAAVAQRREHRAHFLATVLKRNGYDVSRQGDRVDAMLGKRPAEAVEESLVMLGRLLVSARHLDMLMDSQAKAETYARAFLDGDFCFEFAAKETG